MYAMFWMLYSMSLCASLRFQASWLLLLSLRVLSLFILLAFGVYRCYILIAFTSFVLLSHEKFIECFSSLTFHS